MMGFNANTSVSIRDQVSVLQVAEGFYQSSVVFALLKLRIFERIGEGSKTARELAAEIGAEPAALIRLLNAGLVLHLLESEDGESYAVAEKCRSVLLPSAGENYLGNWIRNLEYFCKALSKLDEAVLSARPTVEPSAYVGGDKATTREFELAMHNYAALRGKELAHYLDLRQSESLLDVGSGPGTYSFHLGMANPQLQLNLIDSAAVLEVAREVETRYPLTNEVHYIPCDAVNEEIPGTYDTVLVSNMLHMLGDNRCRSMVKKLYTNVKAGGSLVIQAQYLSDDRRGGRWPVFLDLTLLCVTREGRNHSIAETKEWMQEAGFSKVEHSSMSLINTNSFVRGYK
jgi:cyclopropane fatty-acyl-phospholipid synthase-like methyltransferase